MDFKYIPDVEYIENVIDLFLEFVSKQPEQRGLKPSFANGYLALHEKYKIRVNCKANELLDKDSWNTKALESGKVFNKVIRLMDITGNNLVDWYQKMDYKDRLNADPKEGTSILYDFFLDNVDDETSLERLVGFFGRKYDSVFARRCVV